MFGHLFGALNRHVNWVPLHILVLEGRIWADVCQQLGRSVDKVALASELESFLCIHVLHLHASPNFLGLQPELQEFG